MKNENEGAWSKTQECACMAGIETGDEVDFCSLIVIFMGEKPTKSIAQA